MFFVIQTSSPTRPRAATSAIAPATTPAITSAITPAIIGAITSAITNTAFRKPVVGSTEERGAVDDSRVGVEQSSVSVVTNWKRTFGRWY